MHLSKRAASSLFLLLRVPSLVSAFAPPTAIIGGRSILVRSISPHGIKTTTTSIRRSFRPSLQPRFAIVDEVTEEMKSAMKAKDKDTLNTVRLIRSAFANAAIEFKTEALSDEQAIAVLKKMAKSQQEAIDIFEANDAPDRAEAERVQLRVLERWLPEQADEETVRGWVVEAIAEAGGDNMGKVMGALMKKHKADVDGKVAQKIVKEEMAKL